MTVRIHLSGDDLAEIRFAFSPIWELGMSLMKTLRDPSKHALHLPWVAEAREAIEGRDLGLLFSLVPEGTELGYIPDFLTPPPETPFPEFEEELERVADTDPERVSAEILILAGSLGDQPLPEGAARLGEDPPAWMPQLVDQMREYWKLTIEPHWPRIRALLEGDVMYRARQLALGGAEALFDDLHPAITYADGVLTIDKHYDLELNPDGRGLLLIPAVFDWPGVAFLHNESYQPTLSYSPRGIASIWESEPDERTGAMDELIGDTRAEILRVLEIPMTTSEIAQRLHLTPAAVSQQLGVLRRAGVVDAHRQGRGVYSKLTPSGKKLLELLT
jgi:DNA-binding transcriptional ArsR family regulator